MDLCLQVDVAVDDGSGGNAPRDISLPKYQCAQEESGFILEGADHPSPVSVLDSPIFQDEFHSEELSPSSNSVKSSNIRHEGTISQLMPSFLFYDVVLDLFDA